MGNYTLVPYVAIKPGMLLAYSMLDPAPVREANRGSFTSRAKADAKAYTGLLTRSSKKRLINAINLLVAISLPKKAMHFDSKKQFTFRVNFITLTLPAPQGSVSDKELKLKALKPWIEYWKDRLPGFSYVWRAERQENGNLHFHLMGNAYIHYKDLRDSWNRSLRSLGFIDLFKTKHGHEHPNSTDVHAVHKIRDLAAYVAKYMSKAEKHPQGIEGRVWDCSANLKTKARCQWPMDYSDGEAFTHIFEAFPAHTFNTDHCAGVHLTEKEMHAHFPAAWVREYSAHLKTIREAV